MLKKITINTETHIVVPIEMTREMAKVFMESHKLPYNVASENEYRPKHTWAALLKTVKEK